ncbi:hypothetical protein AURDEDRAFT_115896 [Auricularia subglabra TFB-10046 SS5]|nr:hypothetical protein AURDEDRAFT_115896 [Auricularia subglabra TFB-10046 SS5]
MSSTSSTQQVQGLDSPWASLDTPVGWSLSKKAWIYSFGWFLQRTIKLVTFNVDRKIKPRKRSVWVDTGADTGRCRLVMFFPRNYHRNQDGGPEKIGLVVHLHGGGWAICRPEIESALPQHIADTLGTIVISPDYRKAPWWPYPHALLQIYNVLALISCGGINHLLPDDLPIPIDTSRIAITGCSAGGNLAAAVTLLSTRRPLAGGANVVGLGLMYPVLDRPYSYETRIARFGRRTMPGWFSQFIVEGYLPPPRDELDPYVSPLLAPEDALAKFPKTVVVTAANDYLATEGDEFAQKLRDGGVDVQGKRFEDVVHGFDVAPTRDPAEILRNGKAREEAWGMIVRAFKTMLA